MRTRLNDFRRQWSAIEDDAVAAMRAVGASGWYILGSEVREFESALASSCGVADAVGVASGLDAIEIALSCLGIGAGDRVLTTPLSAFATTLALVRAGATPVFVDVDDNGLLDLDLARRVLEHDRGIRALLPVHLYGQPLDLDALARLKDELGLLVVEDCAQAIGATWGGRAVGTVGDLAALSFYPTKNLGALGDGGAILCPRAEPAALARALRHYGQTSLYRHDHLGWNSRLDELQAALLRRALLPRLSELTARRRAIAARYLGGIDHPGVRLAPARAAAGPVWHLFPVRVAADRREALARRLAAEGVESAVHYPTLIPDQRALAGVTYEVATPLDRAHDFATGELSLPIHPFLGEDEVEGVIAAVNGWEG
jgi:dTDP-3-amino-3,4,6-trideoxy-alpha-D-glucose transaminase